MFDLADDAHDVLDLPIGGRRLSDEARTLPLGARDQVPHREERVHVRCAPSPSAVRAVREVPAGQGGAMMGRR
jgi:hypothetical protein